MIGGWVEANFGDSVVNLAHVEVIHRHVTGRAGLQLRSGDTLIADEPFEAVVDRVLGREVPPDAPVEPGTGAGGA